MSGRPIKYSIEFISEIVALHESGKSIADISDKIGIPANTLTRLINRRYGNLVKEKSLGKAINELRHIAKVEKNRRAVKKRQSKEVSFTVRVDKKVNAQIKEFIAESDINTVADFVRSAIKEKLGRKG
jgi:regulator of PEP synthase PpsR (kinase-PPPase family)